MKCQERKLLIEEFMRTLSAIEHEWENITNSDEYEHYICRHCLITEKWFKPPGDVK